MVNQQHRVPRQSDGSSQGDPPETGRPPAGAERIIDRVLAGGKSIADADGRGVSRPGGQRQAIGWSRCLIRNYLRSAGKDDPDSYGIYHILSA